MSELSDREKAIEVAIQRICDEWRTSKNKGHIFLLAESLKQHCEAVLSLESLARDNEGLNGEYNDVKESN